jgi:histidinol dehydrogenase
MIRVLREKAEIAAFIEQNEQRGTGDNSAIEKSVREIIEDVRTNGDAAVQKYTKKWDCENPQYYRVSEDAIDEAYNKADAKLIDALKRSKKNIELFHEKQRREGYVLEQQNGVILKQIIRPLDRVGIYVPGGTAPLISTVLMCAVPAKIAGVGEIIMTTPPQKDGTPNPEILAAAKLCGVDKIFMCGGAQAIAALAYGTAEIPSVSKITGPGNAYVTAAKKLLFGKIDIDMIAGPSEVLILADSAANPRFIAADLLSQAEHDVLSSAVLITDSESLATHVIKEIGIQLTALARKEIAAESLKNYSGIILVDEINEAVKLANLIAPEHLEVLTENPFELEEKLLNFGSLFLGEYSPEPLGDYFAGPNHVLPTNGTARFSSPLTVDDFLKKSSSIFYTKEALKEASEAVVFIAECEGLGAHANSIKVRCEN